jgi:hypothetical protein
MRIDSVPTALFLSGLLLLGFCGSSFAEGTYNALSFDGQNDYVEVGSPAAFGGGPLTIEAWVRPEADMDYGGRVISNCSGADDGCELMVGIGENSTFMAMFTVAGIALAVGYISESPGNPGWRHLAVTWDGAPSGTLKLFADGEEIGSGYFPSTIPVSPATLKIGARGDGSSNFQGTIDDVRVWSTALDGSTIRAWRRKPVDPTHPNYANLEEYWRFDEGTGQVAASMVHSPERDGQLGSTTGVDATDPTWTVDVSPVPAQALTFGQIKWGWFSRPR